MSYELRAYQQQERVDFVDKYNQWLSSLKEGSEVNVRYTDNFGKPTVESATIRKITDKRIVIEQTRKGGLCVWSEFFKMRPKSAGLPQVGEALLEPKVTAEMALAYELTTIMGNLYGMEVTQS